MNIGRRSPVTHNAFLKMAEQNRIFYIYDTIHSTLLFPEDHQQHRQLLANMAKRSRYFLVNTPKIDRDIETNGQNEIGFRFFEGAASGAIMIGQPPDNQAFKEHFDWPDAVIPMGFDEPDVAKILKKLDSEPERLAAIRRNGIVQSLLRHDWAYRWRAILDIVGLEPQPALVARERRLKQLAELAKNTPDFPFS
jgi:spore maturation protein CgeB